MMDAVLKDRGKRLGVREMHTDIQKRFRKKIVIVDPQDKDAAEI